MTNIKWVAVGDFYAILNAAEEHDLRLVVWKNEEGNPVTVLCLRQLLKGGRAEYIPLAKMFDCKPLDELGPASSELEVIA